MDNSIDSILNKKIKKLRVRNFLAYKDFTINFDRNGAYHIWGENSIGKSALMYVLSVLVQNTSNQQYKGFLRDGCTTFVIDCEFWDNNKVTLSRGAVDFYAWEIDGFTGRLDKTKGQVPDILSNYFNFYVGMDRNKYCVNIRLARETLLFVDTTAGENAYLLQKALGTEEILLAMKVGDTRRKEAKRQVTTLSEILETENEKLKLVVEDLNNYDSVLENTTKIYDVINTEYEELLDLEDIVELGNSLSTAKENLTRLSETLGNVNIDEVKKVSEEYKELHNIMVSVKNLSDCNKNAKVIKAKMLPDADLNEISNLAKELQEIEDMMSLQTIYNNISQKESQLKTRYVEYAKNLEEINSLVEPLKEMNNGLVEVKKFSKFKKEADELKTVYIQSDKDMMDYMVENSFCPLVAKSYDKKCPFGKGA